MENICISSCNFQSVRDLIGKKKQNKKTETHKRVEELKNRPHGAEAISKDSFFLDVDKYRRGGGFDHFSKMIKTHPTNHLLVVLILNPRISRYGEVGCLQLGEGRRANICAICS